MIYLVTALSCSVLAVMFYREGNLLPAVLIFGASLYYLWRLVRDRRDGAGRAEASTDERAQAAADAPASDEVARARAELGDILVDARRNRKWTLTMFGGMAVIGGIILTVNPPLAGVAFLFAAVFGVLAYRNDKAVRMIEARL